MSLKPRGRFGITAVAVLIAMAALSIFARAQNLPPPGAYRPIPNFTGLGAGLQFRKAINDRFSGAQPIAPTLISIAFADLPNEFDGSFFYCNDCRKTIPCTGGGSGAFALGQAGIWACAAGIPPGGPLTADLAAAGYRISGLGAGTLAGDALSVNQTNAVVTKMTGTLNNTINPTAPPYNVHSSAQTSSCSGTAGNQVITCSGGDFVPGDGIAIPQAGAFTSISAPTSLTVTNITRAWFENGTVPGGGGTITVAHAANFLNDFGVTYGQTPLNHLMPELPLSYGSGTGKYTQSGGVYSYGAGDAGQPLQHLYEWQDNTGGTSHIYKCAAFDGSYGLTDNATTTNITSAATLSSVHLNRLTCGPVSGALGYAFCKDGAWLGSTGAAVTGVISDASNTSPIVITTTLPHGLSPMALVTIAGVGGNLAANGTWAVLASPAPTSTTFAIGVTGSNSYTTGGTFAAGGTFDDFAPAMGQAANTPWFWRNFCSGSGPIAGPLMGSSSTTSVTVTAINGSSYSLSTPPLTTFTPQNAIHDNTGAFASAMSDANAISTPGAAHGAKIVIPPGSYYGDWTLLSNVTLDCQNSAGSAGNLSHSPSHMIHVRPGQPGIQSDPSNTSLGGGINGCAFRGFGAGGLGDIGFKANGLASAVITHNLFQSDGDQSILTGGSHSASFYNGNETSGLFDHNRVAQAGACQFTTVDDRIENNNCAAETGEHHVSGPGLFSASFYTSGSGAFIDNNNFEFGDVAAVNLGAGNRYSNDRFEFSQGHGAKNLGLIAGIVGTFSIWSGDNFQDSNQDASLPGVFDEFNQSNSAPSGIMVASTFRGTSSVRHLVWDATSSTTNPFRFTSLLGVGATSVESAFQLNPNMGSGISYPSQAPAMASIGNVSFAGNATPDVSQLNAIAPSNVTPTNITNFCNGPPIGGVCQPEASGRILYVLGDGNTTFVPGASLVTLSGGNELAVAGKQWAFQINKGVWTELLGLAPAGTGACTNQVATALNGYAAPTCSSLTPAMAGSGFFRNVWSGGTNGSSMLGTATNFWPPNYQASVSTSEAGYQTVVPFAATARNFYCQLTTTPPATTSFTFTFRKNAGNTALTCTVAAGATSCSDVSDAVALAAGDLVDMQSVPTNTPTATPGRCAIELDL